jgi:hypothetical protein
MPICICVWYLIVPVYKKILFIVFFLKVLTDVLMAVLLQEGPQTMVGVATFDSTIHFYNLKRALQQVTVSCNNYAFAKSFKNFIHIKI